MDEVLVAVDGSEHSEKVVDVGIDLAKRLAARLAILFVMEPVKVPHGYTEYARSEDVPPSYYDQVSGRIVADLGARADRQGVKYEGLYEVGNPTEQILEAARKRSPSMIVVGVHGLHKLGRVRALGSTSRRVIENADVPVVTVP
jgi:nucleotide-binding universal stress UspA family protein